MATKGRNVTDYICLDFETGGLDMGKCAITEFAAIAIAGDTLEEIVRYETLVKPYDAEYNPKALEITGLSLQKLSTEGKDWDTIGSEIMQFFKTANRCRSTTGFKPVCVAHNAKFDRNCLQKLSKDANIDLSKLIHGDKDIYGNFVPHMIDTIDIGKLLYAHNERMTNFKLGDVLDKAGIPIYDAHRAMNDVEPMTEFFRMAIKMLRAADRSNVLSQGNATVNEEGQIVRETGRTFKFQFAL